MCVCASRARERERNIVNNRLWDFEVSSQIIYLSALKKGGEGG